MTAPNRPIPRGHIVNPGYTDPVSEPLKPLSAYGLIASWSRSTLSIPATGEPGPFGLRLNTGEHRTVPAPLVPVYVRGFHTYMDWQDRQSHTDQLPPTGRPHILPKEHQSAQDVRDGSDRENRIRRFAQNKYTDDDSLALTKVVNSLARTGVISSWARDFDTSTASWNYSLRTHDQTRFTLPTFKVALWALAIEDAHRYRVLVHPRRPHATRH